MVPIVALLVALSPPAAGDTAQARLTRLRVDVRGGAACVSADAVARRVAARSSRIRLSDDNATVVASVNVISQGAATVLAELSMTAPGVQPQDRRVTAGSCAEAADAIALIIVVTLDPAPLRGPVRDPRGDARAARTSSGLDPTPTPSPSPSPFSRPLPAPAAAAPAGDSRTTTRTAPTTTASNAPGPAPRPIASPAPVTSNPPPAFPGTPIPSGRRAPPPAVVEVEVPKDHRGAVQGVATSWQIGGSLSAQSIFGPAPNTMLGFALTLMIAAERQGAWAPALFVGWAHVGQPSAAEPGGSAAFTLDAATLDACPLRWRWSRLSGRPCAALLIGRLASRGSETTSPASAARPFGASGFAIAATFGDRLQLSARAGLGFTLIQDSYEVGGPAFFRAGRFTMSASVGIGARWP